MKITAYKKVAASFSPWTEVYTEVAQALRNYIRTDTLEVVHIGSTSFKVGGKGIIDLMVLYQNQLENDVPNPIQLNNETSAAKSIPKQVTTTVDYLLALGFQKQESDNPFPAYRPRLDGSVIFNNKRYYVHIHVIAHESSEHKQKIQFRDYMLSNNAARQAYEMQKKHILAEGIIEQEAYGKSKSPFIKSILKNFQ